ncbi:uncharacterized protein I303_108389 [Kwoniella dejecticola CBS 10117]|uniref:Trimethylguanosine synthase n=1 Tax=Kwoniella dejecticola CBS 10117 TaxID=1296121 RepID=A0A1A5ZXJ4_9TREE|nr:uncharacterized protein I303_07284 [Kwoniella dejecticola CBS 10117]OBR82524.1 hypothetical protein I303_07284 [Kwoniella dejecticola CBS 10117]
MPARRNVGRSLFASLPIDLRQSLRSQSFDKPEEVRVKAEQILQIPSSGLLSTQPQSESGGEDEEEEHAGPSGTTAESSSIAKAVEVMPGNGIVKSRRTEPIIPKYDLAHAASITPTGRTVNAGKKRKKGRRPVTNPLNPYLGHAWDCTSDGLVERYTDYHNVPKDLIKYFAQRRLYFPLYDQLPVLLDHTGWFSITPQPIAQHIAQRCKCDLIIDAFCGVGGNTIEFAKTCERVIAIDNDLTRLKLARHNALHHGVADRIEFILGCYTDFVRAFNKTNEGREENVDVVFLSPPWGGIDYLNTPSSTYPLSSILPIHGAELFDLTTTLTPNIAYYLPRNTDLKELSTLARTLESEVGVEVGGEDANGNREGRTREWVEIEEEWVGEKLKAITAYFGGLVADE